MGFGFWAKGGDGWGGVKDGRREEHSQGQPVESTGEKGLMRTIDLNREHAEEGDWRSGNWFPAKRRTMQVSLLSMSDRVYAPNVYVP